MVTLADLQGLSQGTIVPSNGTTAQTVIVTSPVNNTVGPCLPCEDNVCEITPTQAVTLDVGRFNRSNSKIRARIDTTDMDNPNQEQTMVVFADFSIDDAQNFPQDAEYFTAQIGENPGSDGRILTVSTTAASATVTSAAAFLPSDVGAVLTAPSDPDGAGPETGVWVGDQATIIAYVNASTVTVSQVAIKTATFATAINQATANGATINGDPAAGWASNLNNNLTGGAVLSTIVVQYNSDLYPELSALEIIAGHNPLDPSVSPVVVNELNPLCDSCSTNSNGAFTTHTYTISHGISWRDWVVLNIPAVVGGVVLTVDFCFGAVGLPNTQMDTYTHQAS